MQSISALLDSTGQPSGESIEFIESHLNRPEEQDTGGKIRTAPTPTAASQLNRLGQKQLFFKGAADRS